MKTPLDLTQNDEKVIAEVAKRRGYSTPRAYLYALIDADAAEHDEPLPFEQEDEEYILNAVQQGMRDALRGDVLTEEDFWQAVRDDD